MRISKVKNLNDWPICGLVTKGQWQVLVSLLFCVRIKFTGGEPSSFIKAGLANVLGGIVHSSLSWLVKEQLSSCIKIPQMLPGSTFELLNMYRTVGCISTKRKWFQWKRSALVTSFLNVSLLRRWMQHLGTLLLGKVSIRRMSKRCYQWFLHLKGQGWSFGRSLSPPNCRGCSWVEYWIVLLHELLWRLHAEVHLLVTWKSKNWSWKIGTLIGVTTPPWLVERVALKTTKVSKKNSISTNVRLVIEPTLIDRPRATLYAVWEWLWPAM